MTSDRPPVLIEVAELAARLLGPEPPLVLDVRWELSGPPGRDEFAAGHIPGAVFVDLETELAGPPGPGGRHPLPDVEVFGAAMRAAGVDEEVPVVAYDAATGQAAARLWWLLTDAGHPRVQVLNGGLAAWRAAGEAITEGGAVPARSGRFVPRPGGRPRADAEEIGAGLGQPGGPLLVDVRAPERFAGDREPIDPVAGHIPGARNLPTTGNVDAQGRFLPAADIAARFDAIGATGDVVLYCGSGVTAAHALLALESAGRTGRLYPGSWSEWIRDPARPVATGPQP